MGGLGRESCLRRDSDGISWNGSQLSYSGNRKLLLKARKKIGVSFFF